MIMLWKLFSQEFNYYLAKSMCESHFSMHTDRPYHLTSFRDPYNPRNIKSNGQSLNQGVSKLSPTAAYS